MSGARPDGEAMKRADPRAALSRVGGEFLDAALEAAFEWERMGETIRLSRILMIASVILNALFYLSDWRFAGTPQFMIAIPARTAVILLAAVTLLALPHCRTPREIGGLMTAWMILNALAVTALVTSHSNIALFVVIMLPSIYYLVVPTRFRWTMVAGAGCSMMLLAGYGEHHGSPHTALGLALAMVVLNCALALSVSHRNRLQRLQWLGVHAERRISAELADSRVMFDAMFATSPVPMVVTQAATGEILYLNESCVDLIQAPRHELIGTTLARFYADAGDRERLKTLLQRDGVTSEFEIEVRNAKGESRFVMVKAAIVDTPQGKLNMTAIIDITHRRDAERSLEWLASIDSLTGLLNRSSFFANGRAEISRASRSGQPLSLMMIDLDHFKAINDTWGHQGGDRALQAFAGLCLSRLRDLDLIGRLGGEEFAVLLPNADLSGAAAVADELRLALSRLTIPGSDGLRMTASFGVTAVMPGEVDLEAAIGRADCALYRAKRGGRNRVAVEGKPLPVARRRAG